MTRGLHDQNALKSAGALGELVQLAARDLALHLARSIEIRRRPNRNVCRGSDGIRSYMHGNSDDIGVSFVGGMDQCIYWLLADRRPMDPSFH